MSLSVLSMFVLRHYDTCEYVTSTAPMTTKWTLHAFFPRGGLLTVDLENRHGTYSKIFSHTKEPNEGLLTKVFVGAIYFVARWMAKNASLLQNIP